MIRTFRTAFAVAVCLVGVCVTKAAEPIAPGEQKPTQVINLTAGAEDLHAVVMGLHFAEHGLADGREVVIFFNVKAPPLARRELDDTVRFRKRHRYAR